ncbi:MAG: ferritin-like domain-containing protein [Vicinamibacterales bacterium]|nr:ferritin-like domain-containing protein [Vicinamibacterales bacterium]
MAVPTHMNGRGADGAPDDRAVLAVALGLEHEAVAAYQAAVKSGLLKGDGLEMATSFLRDHERHRDTLAAFLRRLGVPPERARTDYAFGTLTSVADILGLAERLEQGALDAYLGNAGALTRSDVLDAAAGILADETRHVTALRLARAEAVTVRPKY